ncbi:MAG: NAD(P)-dependent oxidoreductase [Alphaproteobacteria bacterium]|nr:MAG: NAD(P)-dependent oxidoreductase [Alphaproteobacteria bacterium]
MPDKELGFIGVGRMGIHMAGRLIDAGYAVTVFDTNETAMQRLEQRGAKHAGSAADVASKCETVLVSLPTPDIVKAVALGKNGVIEGGKAKVFVDLSTTGPRVAKEVAEGLAKKGITAVDAPVSGGPSGAEKGTLAMMIACPRALADELRPVIEVLGKFFYIGEEPGLGQTMKVINNLLSATAITITSEAMVMGVKAGLDPTTMLDVINAGSGRNTATADKFPRCVVPRRFDFGFTTALLYKDIKLCLDEAEALGVPMIVGNAVRQMMAIGKAAQGPDADITEFVKPLEKLAGVEVGKKA